jgi:hypothetical protein
MTTFYTGGTLMLIRKVILPLEHSSGKIEGEQCTRRNYSEETLRGRKGWCTRRKGWCTRKEGGGRSLGGECTRRRRNS